MCGEGGANTSCSCVNIMLPFFFTLGYLSRRGGFQREEPEKVPSPELSGLLSHMHSCNKNTCRCVPLHPPNVSVHESPPLAKHWLDGLYIQSAKMTFKRTHSQETCMCVKMETAPRNKACVFTHATNS